jgi:predicted Zn-dependent protease
MAIETLEGYFRSHPLPSERIEEVNHMIRAENWEKLTTERPLEVEYLFLDQRARRSQAEHQYGKAAKLASRSLEIHPDQSEALDVLAWAQFMQAQFGKSAATIRKLLDSQPEDLPLARRYSSALGATGSNRRAAQEFQSWMDGVKYSDPDVATQVRVDEAGLWLLAGNDGPAAAMAQQLRQRTDAGWAPECMNRLGWWYYGAGNYGAAASLLSDAVELWPGSSTSQLQLGWTYVAQQKYESALQRFGQAQSSGETAPAAAMGLAVANWRARRADEAVAYCSFSIEKEPAWRNEQWITALYGSSVAASIGEIQAERERRLKAERKGQTRPAT